MKGNNKISFSKRVYEITKNISKGTIMSYKEVAKAAGSPKAWRAVGNILHKNKNPQVPCHRVVRSDGRPGGYRTGRNKKIDLLKKEGAKIKP
ncbi:MAG: MGMT family protein [Candidatus Bathyarchaeota archaeon]|nr:MGMT family protein [Candidatus Bathyarchaeota archaeon]